MYSKNFDINKNFQSSVNLDLDLENESRIYEYVPTTDICDVLKRYVKAVLGKTKDRATTLVGPYGKGKSFLLLVLTYIVSKNKDTKCWKILAEKIKRVDDELYQLLIELKEKNISLLPVIINSNYDNLDQSFMLALCDALKRESMESIIPKNAYSVALDTINKWNKDKSLSSDLKKVCLEKNGSSLIDIERGLKQYSKIEYDKFCEIYYCVTRGVKFNPFINGDVAKIYADVSYQTKGFGYSGIFVIFDEFSKFIESSTSDVSKGLKLIQDLAEKSTRTSKNDQLHLCCVTHKNISLYNDNQKDSFKAVEGRFAEIRFNRSLEENYQLISAAIIKSKEAINVSKKYIVANNDFFKEIESTSIFNNNSNLFEDLFPLNPLTAYSLIQLSELVAQNERTLYTFLSDSDVNSFNFFLHNNDYQNGLFNVDKIYDYFSDLLQKEEANFIRNIWYRAESISSKLDNSLQKRIIKALAIILMINDYDRFPPTNYLISLCLAEDVQEIEKVVDLLIESHHLRKNILNGLLSFALSNTKHIDDKIAVLSKTKYKNLEESVICNQLNSKKYLIPRKHNEIRKITRFYKAIFVSEKEFLNLANFDIYFDNNFCDGIVLNLLRKAITEESIEEKVKKISNSRVVVCYPKKKIEPILSDELLRFACLNEIKNEPTLDEISKEEINLLIEETTEDIAVLFDKYFEQNVTFVNSKFKDGNLSSLLSEILDEYYPKVLVFNNELVNKRELSKQYQKAVNNVIDKILNGDTPDFNPTSPEASVLRAVIEKNKDKPEFREVINSIKEKLLALDGKKERFSSLFSYLEMPPYGIRKGIIPILISVAISELNNTKSNIIIFFDKKEILLNSENLVKATGKDSYYLSCSKGSAEQLEYLNKMLTVFKVTKSNSTRIDAVNLTNTIKKYFMGQPSIIRSCRDDNFLNLDDSFIQIKNIFLDINTNPHEAIFIKPLQILNTKNYSRVAIFFDKISKSIESSLNEYKTRLIEIVKSTFKINFNSSLKSGLSDFINEYIKDGRKIILDEENKMIENAIINNSNYDDYQTIEELAKACLGNKIEDWEKDNSSAFEKALNSFKENISNGKKFDVSAKSLDNLLDKDFELSGIGTLLNNNIESAIDEFSDSVSNEEKVKILTNILRKYL